MRDILIATTNAGKKFELEAMLCDLDLRLYMLSDFPNIVEVAEDGDTFAANASKKALGYAKQTNLWTIADDSGLEVDYLNGEPGIHSARFSGTHKDHSNEKSLIDHENIEKLLHLLAGVPQNQRFARFVCALALASPDKLLAQTRGVLEGEILTEKRGEGGFGYDPVFYVPQVGKTAAQMSKDEKNSISHRFNAVKMLKPQLKGLLATEI